MVLFHYTARFPELFPAAAHVPVRLVIGHYSVLVFFAISGFVIAFSEVFVTYSFKKVLGYLLPTAWQPEGLSQLLTTDYKVAVSFTVLVLVLLFRPTGIFKGKSA